MLCPIVRPVAIMHTDHQGAGTQCRSCCDAKQRRHQGSRANKATLSFSKWDTGLVTTPEQQPTKSQLML